MRIAYNLFTVHYYGREVLQRASESCAFDLLETENNQGGNDKPAMMIIKTFICDDFTKIRLLAEY